MRSPAAELVVARAPVASGALPRVPVAVERARRRAAVSVRVRRAAAQPEPAGALVVSDVRAAHKAFDVAVGAIVRKARTIHSIPCRKGCDACCYDIAWISRPEAELLAERVRSWSTRRRAALVGRLAAWFFRMEAAGLDPKNPRPPVRDYHRAKLACPLLEDGECSVYDVRPLSCRGHYVIAKDASVCANRAVEPCVTTLDMDGPMVPAVLRMCGGALEAVANLEEFLLPTLLHRVLTEKGGSSHA